MCEAVSTVSSFGSYQYYWNTSASVQAFENDTKFSLLHTPGIIVVVTLIGVLCFVAGCGCCKG